MTSKREKITDNGGKEKKNSVTGKKKTKNRLKHCKENTRIKSNRVLINQNKLRKPL